MGLTVNLAEFSELCGVTEVTMRKYVSAVEGNPGWLIARGRKGFDYEIEPVAGLAWWKAKLDDDETASAERKAQLQQLRFDELGDAAEGEEALALSGKARREEYAAVTERIKLRRMMGELVEVGPLEQLHAAAVIELRRQLLLVPAEFAVETGIEPAAVKALELLIERAIETFIARLPVPGQPGA